MPIPPRRREGEPLSPPLVPASTFISSGDPSGAPFTYGRTGNPTWTALEEAYAHVRAGLNESVEASIGRAPAAPVTALAFASGMAACAAVIDGVLPRGGRVIAPADGYYAVRSLLRARAVEAEFVASTDPLAFAAAARGAALVWVETPTNPGLDVVDLEATARACREAGALLVVDNTLATAAGQDPFAFGADVVVVSGTKATSGHSDAVIGLATARDPALVEKLRVARTLGGAVPGALEAWLCLRGLKTVELRVARSSASALVLARALAGRMPVRYPGLPEHPAHALVLRQMTHCGPVLTFDLTTQERAERFCGRLERIALATSFGGVESTLERRARWGSDLVSPGLIRMSVGLEAPELLLEDIEAGLR